MANTRKRNPSHAPMANTGDAVKPLLDAGQALFQGWAAMNAAIAEFTQARLQQNIELGQALASSRGIDDMVALQSSFAQTAMTQYVEQTEKLMKLGAKTIADSLAAAQESAKASPALETPGAAASPTHKA